MITADIFDIAVLISAIAFVVLIAVTVPTILQLKQTIKAMEDLAIEGKKTAEGLNYIIKRAADQLDDSEELIHKVKETGIKITGLVDTIVDNIKSPIVSILSVIFGVEEGFKTFFHRAKKGGDKDVNP